MAIQQYLMMGSRATPGRTLKTGALYAFGNGSNGQLGQGDTTDHFTDPVQIGALTDWQNTVVQDDANYGWSTVKSDGTLWSCGYNNYGNLADGTTTSRSSPVQIGSDTDWKEGMNTGYSGFSAIKTDGTLWTCGYNINGQLGHGDETDRSSPTQVGSLTDWLHIVHYGGGSYRNLAIKTDGTLWFWGRNTLAADFSSPAQIGSATDWTDVIGMGGDIVKMGKSLFNTRVNPKLLEFIAKNQKIPPKILENLKIHARTLKNASESQKNLFLENIKSIQKAKTLKIPQSKPPVTGVQRPGASVKELPEWTKGWKPTVIKGGKDGLATGGIANHFRTR